MNRKMLVLFALLVTFFFPTTFEAADQSLESSEDKVNKFVADLHNPLLYDVQDGLYDNNIEYPFYIYFRKGIGWPQTATLIIHRETRSLLLVILVSTHDFGQDKVTAVMVDEKFLTEGVLSGHLVFVDPNNAGSQFYKAYKKALYNN